MTHPLARLSLCLTSKLYHDIFVSLVALIGSRRATRSAVIRNQKCVFGIYSNHCIVRFLYIIAPYTGIIES